MNDLQGLRVVVAGAGAVGSVTALTLLRCGARVILIDSADLGRNASGVAAGMLAPAFECLLDPVSADHFPWLAVARDMWPQLAETLPAKGPLIDRSGVLYLSPDQADLQAKAERLKAFDPDFELLPPAEAQRRSPGLRASGPSLFSTLDWRLDPLVMLAALRQAFLEEGGEVNSDQVIAWSQNAASLASGARQDADVMVLATGAGPAAGLNAPELAVLSPIKGQILRFDGGGPLGGPVLRAPGIYVAPMPGGAVAGATMQPGRSDLTIEPEAVSRLQAAAAQLFSSLAHPTPRAEAGIRAATPDGLPMVGPSVQAGLLLAVGARRNGWLLAPAMADVIAAQLRGLPTGAFGTAFAPDRFAFR